MIKLNVFHVDDNVHSATVEAQGINADNNESVTYFRAWYGERAYIMADGAAVILSDQLGQGIVRIYAEEAPEEDNE